MNGRSYVVKHGKCLVEIALRIVETFDRNMIESPYKHYGQLIAELRNELVVVIKS